MRPMRVGFPPHLNFPIRSTKLSMSVEVSEHVFHKRSRYQAIDIFDTPAFGRVLMLDNHIQAAELDEHAYHEALVHIPLLSIQRPKRALVVGGGDGGVLRELCRHEKLQRIDMVEIDAEVIEACKKHMANLSEGAFLDHRVRVHIEDAFSFVKRAEDPYDLIVMDVTDVYEEEDGALSKQLFTSQFYRDCRAMLSDKGFLVTQADNHIFCPYSLEEIEHTFKDLFEKVGSYQALVPSFGGFSAFCWASCEGEVSQKFVSNSFALRYLTETTWALAFESLPFVKNGKPDFSR